MAVLSGVGEEVAATIPAEMNSDKELKASSPFPRSASMLIPFGYSWIGQFGCAE